MPIPAPNPRLEAVMRRAELELAEAGRGFAEEIERRRRAWNERRAAERFAEMDRRSVAAVLTAFARPETSGDRFDALAALGIDVWGREELALLAQDHLCMGWSMEQSAGVLRGRAIELTQAAE